LAATWLNRDEMLYNSHAFGSQNIRAAPHIDRVQRECNRTKDMSVIEFCDSEVKK